MTTDDSNTSSKDDPAASATADGDIEVIDVTMDDDASDAGADGAEATGDASGQQEALDRGREEARRHIQEADGDSEGEKVSNAIDTLREKHQKFVEQHQQAQARLQQTRGKRSNLEDTIDHLRDLNQQDDPPQVMRKWEGAILTAVPHDELTDTIASLEEQHSDLSDQIGQLESREEKLRRGRETTKVALHECLRTKETLGGASQQRQSNARNSDATDRGDNAEDRYDLL